jgi:DNA invertase Pin-like site-specific DNA recombinase
MSPKQNRVTEEASDAHVKESVAIKHLQKAASRREAADIERHAASAELRKRVRDAHAAGVSPTRIAQEAGLSRQAVYEVLQPS